MKLTLLITMFLFSCGSPEVTVDDINVDYDEKNVDKSNNETTNNYTTLNDQNDETARDELKDEVVEHDMTFQIEIERISGPPEEYTSRYRVYVIDYNKPMTEGFKFTLSYNNIEGSVLDPRFYYEFISSSDCEEHDPTKSIFKWFDITVVDKEGNDSHKIRTEVPFDKTWCGKEA